MSTGEQSYQRLGLRLRPYVVPGLATDAHWLAAEIRRERDQLRLGILLLLRGGVELAQLSSAFRFALRVLLLAECVHDLAVAAVGLGLTQPSLPPGSTLRLAARAGLADLPPRRA